MATDSRLLYFSFERVISRFPPTVLNCLGEYHSRSLVAHAWKSPASQ